MTEQKVMSIRLPGDLAGELEAVASVDDKPIAQEIRDAIKAYLAARRADPEFQKRLRASLERNREILDRLAGE
jgi:predicted transcriptional regulator